jgi:hypothetical protein
MLHENTAEASEYIICENYKSLGHFSDSLFVHTGSKGVWRQIYGSGNYKPFFFYRSKTWNWLNFAIFMVL